MKLRKLSRRSFLGQVAGGAVGAGALIVLAGEAGAVVQNDSDSGPRADPPGGGRTGRTDSDPRDRPNYGRRPASDSDPNDPVGRPGGSRCSDSDRGSGADPVGRGRRCGGGGNRVTDRDSGPRSDPPNRRVCSDSDRGSGADPIGRGRRC
jgi:hypothetical protein